MGLWDKLMGREPRREPAAYGQQSYGRTPGPQDGIGHTGATEDERAIARYRYLLRTAPPDRLEEVHAQAFAQLTPQQRQQVLTRLRGDLPQGEAPRSDDPRELARSATRAEMMRPGYMYGAFGGMSMGGMMMGTMFSTIGGVIIGSAIADALFDGYDSSPEAADAGDADPSAADAGQDAGGTDSGDAGVDSGGSESGGDAAGDFGGGDFGGGDFGGGDFGGGDFGGGDFGGF